MKESNNLVVNLNTYSHYSLLSSTLSVDDIINYALKNKQEYVCLTDVNLYCAIEFYKKAIKNNLKPVIGLDLFYKKYNLIIIAKNFDGYKNLIQISSFISKKIDFDLNLYLSNVFIVNKNNSNFTSDKINCYSDNQSSNNRIAINTARYLNKSDYKILTAANYILESKTIENIGDLEKNHNLELKDFSYLTNHFDPIAINNLNKEIKQIDLVIPLNELHLIKFDTKDLSSKSYLKKLCDEKLNQKIYDKIIDSKDKQKYQERMDYELEIIDSMKFNDYFIVVQDFICYAKNNNIIVGPGRGSSAGSLVAFILDITEVDSLKYNLLFERFLNPGRVSMPDIDVDIMDTRRNEVVEYIFNKYGYNRVAHIVTFQRIKSKMAIRDVGRILNINLKIINIICKLIPLEYDDDLNGAIENVNELKQYFQEYPLLFQISSNLIGCPRQTGLHAAGIVISDVDLNQIVPTQLGASNEISTQYSMDYLEELGLLKMDLLGLTNLTTLENIRRIINKLHNLEIDFKKINLEDKKVFEYLSQGNTIGIFQLESPGMTNLVKKLKPKSIEDISLCSAMFRPGPQENIPSFLARRNKQEPIDYPHSSLKDILESTYGIIVYQEQVINIVIRVGNFTASEADIFRRIISKKYGNELEEFKIKFKQKALANGYGEKEFEEIYNYIYKFANYGFNHSHSISYSLISYWLAYLKYYYPVEFMCTLMMSYTGSSSKLEVFVEECNKLNIKVLPPNINLSNNHFSLKKRDILMGFNSIKGIGEETSKKIIVARENCQNKKFDSYLDCVKNLVINKIGQSTIETLIYAGMFDTFELSREYMLLNLPSLVEDCKQVKKNGEFLFEPILKDVNQFNKRIDQEIIDKKYFDLLGFDLNNNNQTKENKPSINLDSSKLEIINKYKLSKFNDASNNQEIFDCLVKFNSIRKIKTKTGKDMAFISFVDIENNKIDLACFSPIYLDDYFSKDKLYIITIKIAPRGNQIIKVKEEL